MSMASFFGVRSSAKREPEEPIKTQQKPHILVIGNEKGGCGKTTTAMHILVSLLRLGFKVGSIDIDSRQRSLSRYIENRRKTMEREGVTLPVPQHIVITRSPFNVTEEAQEDERERFNMGLHRLKNCDFVLVDSPGNDTFLSRLAHSHANTVITPINDSFVDLDVLATVDGKTMKIIRPSIYSEMVWEQKISKAKRDGKSMEWIVMRNRLSNLDARNKRLMKRATEELSRRIGFRLAPGFSERVIYREMFPQGLTVLDVMDVGANAKISMSHVAARQEVRDLLKVLRIPEVDRRINDIRHGGQAIHGYKAEKEAKKAEKEQKSKTAETKSSSPSDASTPSQAPAESSDSYKQDNEPVSALATS